MKLREEVKANKEQYDEFDENPLRTTNFENNKEEIDTSTFEY